MIVNDVLNEIENKKYYANKEYYRILNDNTLNYKVRVERLIKVSEELALLNLSQQFNTNVLKELVGQNQENQPKPEPNVEEPVEDKDIPEPKTEEGV